EVLVDAGRHQRDPALLVEQVRQRLGHVICRALAGDANALQVLTLDPVLEAKLSEALRASSEQGAFVIDPRMADQLIKRLVQQAEGMMKANLLPVLLCSPDLRRHLRMLTERVLPHLRILSMSEVPSNMDLKAFGAVTLA